MPSYDRFLTLSLEPLICAAGWRCNLPANGGTRLYLYRLVAGRRKFWDASSHSLSRSASMPGLAAKSLSKSMDSGIVSSPKWARTRRECVRRLSDSASPCSR
jgi:hypothetical protein